MRGAILLLIGLAIGIVMILLTMNNASGFGRSTSFIGIMIVMLCLVTFFTISDKLLQKILPQKGPQKEVLKKEFVYNSATGIFIFGLIFLLIELIRFEKILRPGDFWRFFYTLGIILSLALIYILPFFSKDLYSTYKRRFSIFWSILIGLPFIVVAVFNMANRVFSSDQLINKEFIVIEQRKFKKRKSNNYNYELTISINETKEKELLIKQNLYNTVKVGDQLTLSMEEGFLGYEIIKEIKKQ